MERHIDIGAHGDDFLRFVVLGQPVAKGRPRFVRRGNHVGTYTPAKTLTYEAMVQVQASKHMRGREPSSKPIELILSLGLQVPTSWSKKRQAMALAGEIRPTRKPDADNVLKGVKDACNGIVWRDDAQVVALRVVKHYSPQPHASVHVRELCGESA